MKILFTGGGTGGHIFPIIAVAREMRRIYGKEDLKFFYIGPKDEFAKILLSQEGIRVKTILAGKIRRYFGIDSFFLNLIDIFLKTPLGILEAFLYLFFLFPDAIFSKGGYGSIPTVIAAWILRVPIFLHESDISPGLANRFLGRFALEIFVSFPRTEYFSLKKMILVGNPIRREILEGSKEEAREALKLTGRHPPTTLPAEGWAPKPVVLIFGGSQGAQKINEVTFEILPELLQNFEVIHQCGEKNFQKAKNLIKAIISEDLKKNYHLFPFLKEEGLRQSYQAADVIVSRAGSGSIFEIAALGKPSILIPLPTAAQNHQYKNAYAYIQMGAALVIEETNFTPRFFLERLRYLTSFPQVVEEMSKKALEFSRPKAGRVIASYLLEFLAPKIMI